MKTMDLETKSSPLEDQVNWDKVNGLLPAIIQSSEDHTVLMLGYMNREALIQTLREGVVCFFSRTKERLWIKGEISGNILKVISLSLDCDGDTLLIKALPAGPVCHTGTPTCFDHSFYKKLEAIIDARKKANAEGSYVAQLMRQGGARIAQKVGEEGVEVALASVQQNKEKILEESADLFFHLLVNLNYHELTFEQVEKVLEKRQK